MPLDKDLLSRQQARDLVAKACAAQDKLRGFSQEEVDAIVAAMVKAASRRALSLAQEAVRETGIGIVEDKKIKNLLASEGLYAEIKHMKTVGVVKEDPVNKIVEIAEPMGVIAALTPVTNPTSTVIFKSLIAIKSRNCIVFSPHPRAVRCSAAAAEVLSEAAVKAGAPEGAIGCITEATLAGTQELMSNPGVSLILATGGAQMVKAAYSSGKPAYGVGPGNVPAFIHRSADVTRAVTNIVTSKCFDNGTICSSEQAIVTESCIAENVKAELRKQGAYFLNSEERKKLERLVTVPNGGLNPEIVGKSATTIASMAGINVPPQTRILIAELEGVGKQYPLSMEKLSPILAFYSVPDWQAARERCLELLKFGGLGHSLVIHAEDTDIVTSFALGMPVSRVLVNTPSSLGAVGYTTRLPVSLTLGCGTWGGNVTTDSLSPLHLLNIKRLAFGVAETQLTDTTGDTETHSEYMYADSLERVVCATLLG